MHINTFASPQGAVAGRLGGTRMGYLERKGCRVGSHRRARRGRQGTVHHAVCPARDQEVETCRMVVGGTMIDRLCSLDIKNFNCMRRTRTLKIAIPPTSKPLFAMTFDSGGVVNLWGLAPRQTASHHPTCTPRSTDITNLIMNTPPLPPPTSLPVRTPLNPNAPAGMRESVFVEQCRL